MFLFFYCCLHFAPRVGVKLRTSYPPHLTCGIFTGLFVVENQMRGIITRLAAGGTCLTENTLLIVDFAFPELLTLQEVDVDLIHLVLL